MKPCEYKLSLNDEEKRFANFFSEMLMHENVDVVRVESTK